MSYADKSVQCSDCGITFTFSAGEQELYATRGFTHEPKRCPSCRSARKSERGGSGFGSRSGYRARSQMFPAVCAQCGAETQVPFEPKEGRPVYCSDCYNKIRVNR